MLIFYSSNSISFTHTHVRTPAHTERVTLLCIILQKSIPFVAALYWKNFYHLLGSVLQCCRKCVYLQNSNQICSKTILNLLVSPCQWHSWKITVDEPLLAIQGDELTNDHPLSQEDATNDDFLPPRQDLINNNSLSLWKEGKKKIPLRRIK